MKLIDRVFVATMFSMAGLIVSATLTNFSLGQWMSENWDTSEITRESNMSWLALLIIGGVIFLIGWFAPFPPPLPLILRFLGAFLLLLGIVILLVGLVRGTDADDEVDTDFGAPAYSLIL